jgi:hypothetical protein
LVQNWPKISPKSTKKKIDSKSALNWFQNRPKIGFDIGLKPAQTRPPNHPQNQTHIDPKVNCKEEKEEEISRCRKLVETVEIALCLVTITRSGFIKKLKFNINFLGAK